MFCRGLDLCATDNHVPVTVGAHFAQTDLRLNSWVMLDDARRFVSLPREKNLYTSPPRTTLALEAGNTYPGKEPLAISCGSGTAYITNQRVSYQVSWASFPFPLGLNDVTRSSFISRQMQRPNSSPFPPRS